MLRLWMRGGQRARRLAGLPWATGRNRPRRTNRCTIRERSGTCRRGRSRSVRPCPRVRDCPANGRGPWRAGCPPRGIGARRGKRGVAELELSKGGVIRVGHLKTGHAEREHGDAVGGTFVIAPVVLSHEKLAAGDWYQIAWAHHL